MNETRNTSVQVFDDQLVIDAVLKISELTWEQIMSKSRKQDIVMARQVLAVLLKIYVGWSDQKIADKLNKERTNVYTCRIVVRDMIDTGNHRYIQFFENVEYCMISIQHNYPLKKV